MSNYLYNGVELPVLPVWDKSVYPYAVITYYAGIGGGLYERYELLCSPIPFVVTDDDKLTYPQGESHNIDYFYISPDGAEWSHGIYGTIDNDTSIPNIVWSNHDLHYRTSGALYLAASDPIPVVGEAAPISPYLRKNGAWQKQDTYKRVGGQWVKQPQDGYDSQDETWNPLFEKT